LTNVTNVTIIITINIHVIIEIIWCEIS